MPVSDRDLLHAWRDGDEKAGEALYTRYFPFVRNLVRGKAIDEEDILQRVFESLVRSSVRLELRSSFRAYVVAVIRHELIADLRRRARDPESFDPEMSSAISAVPSPSQVIARQAEQRLLLEALVRIPLDAQIILELHYWEQLSTAELAQAYDIPRSTAKTRLQRAREQLERQLHAVAIDPAVACRTTRNLERWVRSVREQADWELGR
ncbi:MAG: sigma-70 family RNA polymerase sigma factor [Myxococcota bacterium]